MSDAGMSVAASQLSARQEWAAGWPTLLAATCGMVMSAYTTYVLGFLIAPLQQQFGWTRGEISSALAIVAIVGFLIFPVVGRWVDRRGARRIALQGTVLCGALLALIGLVTNGSLVVWWLSWAIFTVGYAMVNPTVWAKAVSGHFVAGRGMALGVMMCGAALGALILPQIARWGVDNFGWRQAIAIYGIAPAAAVFVLVLLLLRDHAPALTANGDEPSVMPGYTFAEAIRSSAVIKILVSVTVLMFVVVGSVVHMVPLLIETGMSRLLAAAALSVYGMASLVTKLVCGWLSDRGAGSWLGALTFVTPAVACALLLAAGGSPAWASCALTFFGIAAGAGLQMSAYLLSSYAGMRSFGQVYGLCAGLMSVAGGFGPLLVGMIYDATGSYSSWLVAGIPLGLLTGGLMASLGPRPQFEPAPSA